MERNCYTYFLKWVDGKMYYGCRYAKGCDPSDLWDTYFTSSKYIPEEKPIIIKVSRIFGEDVHRCRAHESRFLKKVGAVKSEKWYNLTDYESFYHVGPHTEKTKQKIRIKRKTQVLSEERNKKVSESLKGRKLSEEHKKNISESTKGRIGGRLGKKASEETKRKMSESLKGTPSSVKGLKWWTNGEKNVRDSKPPSEDFIEGFTTFKKRDNSNTFSKNTCWWTDENGNRKRSKEQPGDNWKRGMK